MSVRPWLQAGLAVVLIVVFAARDAQACSCIPPLSVADELDKAKAVFLGTARATEPAANNVPASLHEAHGVRFEVERRWKGDVTATQIVFTSGNEAACGVTTRIGERYLVFAFEAGSGPLVIHLCSRTRLERHAAEDLAALGPGEPPLPDPPLGATNTAESGGGCAIGRSPAGLTPLWLLALLAVGWRSRRS